MSRKIRLGWVIAGLAVLLLLGPNRSAGATAPAQTGEQITLPPGFALRVFASNVQDARFLSYSPQGDLYVGQLLGSNSAITILPDRDHNGQADRAIRVATDLNSPNNVAFRAPGFGTVFATGAFDQAKVYTDTGGDLSFADSAVLVPNLPLVPDQRHKTKTVAYGPDGQLYISVGSIADDPASADPASGIYRYNADGSGKHKLATGLRNTVGLAWDPIGGGMWGVDNGSDDLGRDLPHDELNLLVDGGDYGWPYCIDNQVHNDKTDPYDCSQTRSPAVLLGAHAGALGMTFYSGAGFPARYWGGLFVAYHSVQYTEQRGIWFIPFQAGQPGGPPELFLQRAAADGSTTNRFLGLAVNPYDGSLMVSDDREGRIYQVVYTGPPATPPSAAPAPAAVPGFPAPAPAPPLPGFVRAFAQTGHSLNGAFLQYWFWNGGQDRFGAPVSDPLTEPGADGQPHLVQYTERARFEYHPEARGTAAEVQVSNAHYEDRYGRPGAAGSPTPPPSPAATQAPPPATATPPPPVASATPAPPTIGGPTETAIAPTAPTATASAPSATNTAASAPATRTVAAPTPTAAPALPSPTPVTAPPATAGPNLLVLLGLGLLAAGILVACGIAWRLRQAR